MDAIRDLFGNGRERPPAPEVATADDVDRYFTAWYEAHGPFEADTDTGGGGDSTMTLPFADKQLDDSLNQRAQFPWLYDPERGVRWDFDPVSLRNIAQTDTWVGMMVQTITKEVAETPWTITRGGDHAATRKRLSTHPDRRTPLSKADTLAGDLPDATAERIATLLRNPNPDSTWHDLSEMWLADLLEVGSSTVVKYFPDSAYGPEDDLTRDPSLLRPRALQTSAPEVWTKGFDGRTGILDSFWQFDRERSPGTGDSDGGTSGSFGFRSPIEFDPAEVMWTDMSPRSNRRYGIPPTLLVKDFLQAIDLAVKQEQQYMSRGSTPSGAMVFNNYDREELKEWKQEHEENIKGKPWKMLTIAGKGAGGEGNGFAFEPFSYNFSEMEFTERQRWYARVIASVFQVPTAVVGIEPEKVNYNTFQGERENFEENTLGPYLMKLERFINNQLIEPHWGVEYHFEFKPGVSESTRAKMSERARAEWNANLITREQALDTIGREMPDTAEDGFKSDVVDDGGEAGGPFGDVAGLEQSAKADKYPRAGDDCPECGHTLKRVSGIRLACYSCNRTFGTVSDPDDWDTDAADVDKRTGAAVAFPNNGGRPFASRATLIAFCDDLAEVCNGGVFVGESEYPTEVGGDLDGQPVRAVGITEREAIAVWAEYRDDAVALSDPQVIDSPSDAVEQSGGDTGNGSDAVEKDDPLRGTDAWYQFDVQPHMIDGLQADIADDVRELFEQVLSDDEIQATIERLAAEGPDETNGSGETGKSLTTLSRRLKELLEQTRISGAIADAIREHSADAVRETLETTIEDADPDADPDPEAVDVQAVTSKLRDRDIGFADRFADQLADEIRETVGDGWAEGKNSREIAEDISEQADIAEGWGGAERIARQELQVATGEARSAVAADLDKVEIWNDSGDDRVRDAHAAMDGLWKRPGDDWTVDYSDEGRGVGQESVPGDSEPGIGCRCTTLLRDREEVDADDYAGDGSLN